MEDKKMLFLTMDYPPERGGVARYYGEIVAQWGAGIEVLADRAKLFWRLWPKWYPAWSWLSREVKENPTEMVWVGQVLPLGYVAWWLKKQRGIPYLVFTHGMDILLPQSSWWKKMWLKIILRGAKIVVANSFFTKRELLKLGVKETNTVIVYPCADWTKQQSLGFNKKEIEKLVGKKDKVLLSVGRLVKRKGFDKVIKIMPRLLKRMPSLKYVIIGNGPEFQDCKLEIENCELSSSVIIRDNVDDAELMQWYQRSNALAMPCEQLGGDVEGFGLVFLEAASYGLPVVVGRSGGAPETVHHGYGGFVVEPDSTEELYQALVRLLTDDGFAHRLGTYGQIWSKKHFKWEKEIAKFKDALCQPSKSA